MKYKIVGLSEKGARQLPLIISWAVFIILSSAYLFIANAGELFQSEKNPNEFLFKGQVEMGDSKKLIQIPTDSILYLDSVGGDFIEGLQMGYIIKAKNISVKEYNKGCWSACAFAASMSHDIFGRMHYHAPYDPLTNKPTKMGLEIMEMYLKETGRFSAEEISKIAKTPKDQYITVNFK